MGRQEMSNNACASSTKASTPLLAMALVTILAITGCSREIPPPVRPEAVPEGAVAAVGPDGGAWMVCSRDSEKHVYCDTYFASSGRFWSRGTYILFIDDKPEPAPSEIDLAVLLEDFSLYDGQNIYLGPGKIMRPDGVIDSPFGEATGKRTVYSMGEVIVPETQYP